MGERCSWEGTGEGEPETGSPPPLTSCQLLIHFPNDEGTQPHPPPEPVGQQREDRAVAHVQGGRLRGDSWEVQHGREVELNILHAAVQGEQKFIFAGLLLTSHQHHLHEEVIRYYLIREQERFSSNGAAKPPPLPPRSSGRRVGQRPRARETRGAGCPPSRCSSSRSARASDRRRAFGRRRPGSHRSLQVPGSQSVPQVQAVGALRPCATYQQQNRLPLGTRAGAAGAEEPKSQSYTAGFGRALAGLEFPDANARPAHLNGEGGGDARPAQRRCQGEN
ncbi:unnamed protein product [Rangifer tarandus platyrhynchus]|uniref:Uncharacterized protein n=1 Tax=Rangifer tarandus platyrhynchus TaxID=3082113 RepID=A0ABN8YDE9_RANTA|nr:unnamed protein product [Rangifer tarandus platyrhynchus]